MIGLIVALLLGYVFSLPALPVALIVIIAYIGGLLRGNKRGVYGS